MLPLLMVLAADVADPHPAALVGAYDGGQMKMTVALTLDADGRFHYALSYGALDEEAEGVWAADGDRVLLTSDPVTPPRFVLVNQRQGPADQLQVTLDTPRGMSPRYFDAAIAFAHGRAIKSRLGDDGLAILFEPADPPVQVRFELGVFALTGAPIAIDPAKGYVLALRFEANDLGKADFRGTPLRLEGSALLFQRYGRTITFRRVS